MLWILFYEIAIISVVYSVVVTLFITFETFYYFFAPRLRFWFSFFDRMLTYYTDSYPFEIERPHTTFPPPLACSRFCPDLESERSENIDDYRDDPEVIGRFRGNRAMVAHFIDGCKETIFNYSPHFVKKVGDLVPVGKTRAAFIFGGYFTCEGARKESQSPPVFVPLGVGDTLSPGGDRDPYPFNTSLLVGNVLKDGFTQDYLRGKCDGLILATYDAWVWWAHHPTFFPPPDFGVYAEDCDVVCEKASEKVCDVVYKQACTDDAPAPHHPRAKKQRQQITGMTLRSGKVY